MCTVYGMYIHVHVHCMCQSILYSTTVCHLHVYVPDILLCSDSVCVRIVIACKAQHTLSNFVASAFDVVRQLVARS